jgi:hypothetical protein
MDLIQQDSLATTRRRRDPGRYTGIAFVLFFLSGFVLTVLGPGIYEDGTMAAYAAAHSDAGRVAATSLVAFVLWPLAGVALLVTVARLRTALDAGLGRRSLSGRLATMGATVMAVGLTISGAAGNAAAHVSGGTGPGFPADPASGYAVDMLASQMFTAGMWGGSLILVGVGLAARGTGLVPGWLVWAGFVLAPLMPVAFVLFSLPYLAFVLWIATVCVIVRSAPAPNRA